MGIVALDGRAGDLRCHEALTSPPILTIDIQASNLLSDITALLSTTWKDFRDFGKRVSLS